MRRFTFPNTALFLLGFSLAGCEEEQPPGPFTVTVMTYNVLCSYCNFEEYDPWTERIEHFVDIIDRHDPDLIGFQEFIFAEEVEEIAELNPGYEFLYFHDPHGPLIDDYPDATIFYRAEMFELLDHGFYWLSETPDEPWSTGWADANIWRLVVWAHLRHRTANRELYFSTTHVDNNNPNQARSAPLIVERVEPWAARMPAIVTGDFNSKPDSEAYATLTRGVEGSGFVLLNSWDLAEERREAHNQDPAPEYDPDHRIDHIFMADQPGWSCSDWTVDMYVYGDLDRYPSDHLAMSAVLTYDPRE